MSVIPNKVLNKYPSLRRIEHELNPKAKVQYVSFNTQEGAIDFIEAQHDMIGESSGIEIDFHNFMPEHKVYIYQFTFTHNVHLKHSWILIIRYGAEIVENVTIFEGPKSKDLTPYDHIKIIENIGEALSIDPLYLYRNVSLFNKIDSPKELEKYLKGYADTLSNLSGEKYLIQFNSKLGMKSHTIILRKEENFPMWI